MNQRSDINERALVVLNGQDCLENIAIDNWRKYKYLLAVDGALDMLLKSGISPHAVTGDFDSVTKSSLDQFKKSGGITDYRQEQESTDFEKALIHCLEKDINAVDVIGYKGDRFDHEIAVLDAIVKYSERLDIQLIDKTAVGRILSSGSTLEVEGKEKHLCSMLPLIFCTGVTTSGLKWNLENRDLSLGNLISCSNEIIESPATISLSSGVLLVYIHLQPGNNP